VARASNAPGDGHKHKTDSHPGSLAKHRLGGSDQALNGANLIGKASLNVLEPRGRREITDVEEKRLNVCYKHISLKKEIARFVSSEAMGIFRG
jgi:hypothetical protein